MESTLQLDPLPSSPHHLFSVRTTTLLPWNSARTYAPTPVDAKAMQPSISGPSRSPSQSFPVSNQTVSFLSTFPPSLIAMVSAQPPASTANPPNVHNVLTQSPSPHTRNAGLGNQAGLLACDLWGAGILIVG